MNILFEQLTIRNFMSIGEMQIDLRDQGFVSISGVNNYDTNSKSNGSGKSSILESLIWVLTGQTLRGCKDIVNKYTNSGAKVELKFSIDGDNYILTRYKDDKEFNNNLIILKNNTDLSGKGIRDSQKILEDLLPDLDLDLIGSVIVLGQGLPQKFTNNTPSGRKEILEKLSKSDFMIQDIKEKLAARKSDLSSNLRETENLLIELETKKSIYSSQLLQSEKDLFDLTNTPAIDYVNELADLDINISFQESELSLADKKLSDAISKLQESKVNYSSLDSELKSKQLDISTKYNRNELIEARYAVGGRISFLEENINTAKAVKDICPTCGQKLPNIYKIDTTELEQELANLKAEDCKLLSAIELSKENENKEIYQLQESYKNIKNKLIEECGNCSKLVNDLALVKEDIFNKLSDLKVSKHNLINQRDTYISNISKLKSSILDLKDTINKIDEKILYYNIAKDEIDSRLLAVNKMITIASRDFRGFLLSEIIAFIDSRSKEYSQDVIGTTNLNFYLNGNNIDIDYDSRSYENLSGGEKQKLDIIIQLAIRDMLMHFLGFRSNILALDEIFDNLDSLGCEKIVDLISNKLTDIDSIFIITHHSDDLLIPCDLELKIAKNSNGISEII